MPALELPGSEQGSDTPLGTFDIKPPETKRGLTVVPNADPHEAVIEQVAEMVAHYRECAKPFCKRCGEYKAVKKLVEKVWK